MAIDSHMHNIYGMPTHRHKCTNAHTQSGLRNVRMSVSSVCMSVIFNFPGLTFISMKTQHGYNFPHIRLQMHIYRIHMPTHAQRVFRYYYDVVLKCVCSVSIMLIFS